MKQLRVSSAALSQSQQQLL
jgi:vacuolar-type H+-ATPase subunit E/Vma4